MGINRDMESLRMFTAHFDGQYIWTVDEIFGGLYRIDVNSMTVTCVLQPWEIYKYDSFLVISLIEKDDYIIIVPQLIQLKWVFYNKRTKTVSYRKIFEISSTISTVCFKKDKLYLPPQYGNAPFVIYDTKEMRIHLVIDDFIGKNNDFEIWRIFENEEKLYFPLRGGKAIYCYDVLNGKCCNPIKISMDEKLGDADGNNGENWVLPLQGECIYRVDSNGEILEKIKVIIDGEQVNTDKFVRIIVTDTHIFLLPYLGKNICVYEKKVNQFVRIKCQHSELTNSISYDTSVKLSYYGYLKNEKGVCLLPRFFKFMWIEFSNLNVTQKEIFLPYKVDYKMIYKWIWLRRNGNVFEEEINGSLPAWLKGYIKHFEADRRFQEKQVGRKIYEYLRTQ